MGITVATGKNRLISWSFSLFLFQKDRKPDLFNAVRAVPKSDGNMNYDHCFSNSNGPSKISEFSFIRTL